jgi:hypothetical protein
MLCSEMFLDIKQYIREALVLHLSAHVWVAVCYVSMLIRLLMQSSPALVCAIPVCKKRKSAKRKGINAVYRRC